MIKIINNKKVNSYPGPFGISDLSICHTLHKTLQTTVTLSDVTYLRVTFFKTPYHTGKLFYSSNSFFTTLYSQIEIKIEIKVIQFFFPISHLLRIYLKMVSQAVAVIVGVGPGILSLLKKFRYLLFIQLFFYFFFIL